MKTKTQISLAEACKNTSYAFNKLNNSLAGKSDKRSRFEKFYDFMSNFIFGGKRTVLALIILISLNIHGQNNNALKIGAMYSIDKNVYEENPFAEKDVMVIKILKIKNGWVLYHMIKGWCCVGSNFSQREDIIIDQIKSYNNKYGNNKPYKIYTKQQNQI